VGVDTDQWETLPEARGCLISSSMKGITGGVYNLILSAKEDKFPAGNFPGSVQLAPFHDFSAKIPPEVQARLEQIAKDLENGILAAPTPGAAP
jgi:basic membrane protein A and related proteins